MARRKAPLDERLAYTVDEAAALIGRSKDVVYRWIKDGKLPAVKLNGHMFVLREDFVAFLREQPAVAS